MMKSKQTTPLPASSSVHSSSSVQGAMLVRWLIPVICFGSTLSTASVALPQTQDSSAETHFNLSIGSEPPILDEVSFAGLRHIAPQAVAAHIKSRAGDRFDADRMEQDVRLLARLGWFDSIEVVQVTSDPLSPQSRAGQQHAALLFRVHELPFLSKVEYSGSRLLSPKQIEKVLEERKLTPGLGKPADPAALQRIAEAVRSSLNELGHPEASVQVCRLEQANGTATIRFEIQDGPYLPVRRVRFKGNPGVSEKSLRAQMQSIAPWKPFASLRNKNAYSGQAFEEDRQRILAYYQDHGYPEARIGNARVAKFQGRSRRWLPLPHQASRSGLLLSIPIEAGPFYHLETVEMSDALQQAVATPKSKPFILPVIEQGHAFSQQEVDKLQRFYSSRIQPRDLNANPASFPSVVANPIFDAEKHSVRVKLGLSDSRPYLVHRLEFQGLRKFSDRYVRRRIPLREGQPVDDRALEAGLKRLARTGYFKPIHKEDVHIRLDDIRRTADVLIHLEEIGQQRTTFSGGHAQFGSTLGLAYTVFDLLNCEELLSAQFDGGPETLQVALGIAKEGVFGTRGSLALSVFNNVLRPRFAHGVRGPFFNSRSLGLSIPWTYSLSSTDSVGINYTLSRTTSDEPLGTAPGTTGLPPIDLRTRTSSRSLGTAWAHDTGNERILFSDSVSGGLLGGEENMVRPSGEVARIFRDPFFAPKNAWAFRTTFSAADNYRGDAPVFSRFFSGDEFVRGLRTGELGPLALAQTSNASGATTLSPSPAGANLITAANGEYRIPLAAGTEAAGFFDLGSGSLLPNWLGPTKPRLFTATNGVLHGSTGVELRWTIPGIQVPLRSYYALNVLRLDRRIRLSDKSLFFARNRFSAFGWGLGSLF
jgi:outer membrane protein insertion porin family